jgi:hypothetical protein
VAGWVEEDFRAYLRCGIPAHGFARIRCDDCAAERHVNDHVLPHDRRGRPCSLDAGRPSLLSSSHHLPRFRGTRLDTRSLAGRWALMLVLALSLHGCMGYRLVPLAELELPSYEPREVLVPAECAALIERAATAGVASLTETESRTVAFCQQQQIQRTLEEEAAARRLESHAAAARFALQLTTVVVGGLIVFLGWLL